MNNWKVIFATVVIFGAGVITGGLLVNYVLNSRPKAAHRPLAEMHVSATNQMVRPLDAPKLRAPEILSKQLLQKLQDELQLAPEQNAAIQKIISEGQNQIRKVIQDSRLEIRAVLTPDQQQQFDDLMKRQFRKALFKTNAPAALPLATASNAP